MKFLACFPEKAAAQVMCLTPVLDFAHLDSTIQTVTSNNSTPLSREITATATTTATAKGRRIRSGWYAEQRWGRKEGYASETTGRCSIFCLIMKSVNAVVLFVFFCVFLQVLPRRKALREAREDGPGDGVVGHVSRQGPTPRETSGNKSRQVFGYGGSTSTIPGCWICL